MEWKLTEQGPRATIEVRAEDKGDGLYKAYIRNGYGSLLLGTLVPEGGYLFLRRTVTLDSLKRQGFWPVSRIECRMVHPFRDNGIVIPWTDEVLQRSARRLVRYTVQQSREGFFLVAPFDPRTPFPLTPLFCLSRVEEGRLIFSFRADGTPYIFQPDGKDRKEAEMKRRDRYGKSDHQGAGCAGGSAGL